MGTVIELTGRLHPLVVHFPIAFLLGAAALELARLRERWKNLDATIRILLWFGGIAALVAGGTGLIFMNDFAPAPSERWMLPWHRGLAIAGAIIAVLAAIVSKHVGHTDSRASLHFRRFLTWSSATLIAISAHFGALMVWGADYYTAHY
ncbi:MAG: hypothetical protein M5U15_13475 [Kiritimatiellae bacterium]|nr:hypothetical protein [Kiritimatiellia bacterium]